ncbi:MbnP family protein [Dyadobacter pollutisoli]|uniref:Copper-binding protein MbnP-like domain-containing protein n=1 Tax=Dyadobacter pollutisoli TaxID=2910158 RepID=A0A9E8N8N0_9BACT|nr:MbnP family protein [Dyadobacter pollutisoli]WAC10537.1 hypothetical protein ON006_22665 [Dyadobacter pollutisoli]
MKRTFSFLLPLSLAAVVSLFVLSCDDDDPGTTTPTENGKLRIAFSNKMGSKDLKLGTETYVNQAGEPFTVSKLNYFISNIKLIKTDGSNFVVPQDSSYFLIREANEASQLVTINNVPAGEYSGIEFTIGVDSLRSVSDISKRKGILDKDSGPTNEEAMYWDWNPGYIFLKLEGNSDSATSANGKFYYHIGGFGGLTEKTLNNIRTTKIDFGSQKAKVTDTAVPEIHLNADILRVFNGPTTLSIKANTSVMYSPISKNIADNYVSMFSLDQIDAN